ncbi:MAG: hypothetical protein IPH91_02210 [Elusimicrobia bacterium]|jgi:hypothetical protein|nr:hypothetical protein [Elusimicrobiota bacterium]MBK7687582.1 hypothetical protein [Elusimicrobiota bacterium]MBK8651915.1 hypothetical protein [Elusimicrobiota bacterium]
MNTNDIPFDLIQRVQPQLQGGEGIRWIAPANPRMALMGGLALWLFAIPWTAFALFWMAGAAGFKTPNFKSPAALFPLFGLPFVLIGLAMLASPIFLYRKAKRTFYIITDRRALIFEDGPTVKIQSFGPPQLQNIERIQSPDGSGSLIFTERRTGRNGRGLKIGFLGIKDVQHAEALLMDLVTKAERS